MTLEFLFTLILVIFGIVLLIKLLDWLTRSRKGVNGDASGNSPSISGSSADANVTVTHKSDSDASDSGSDAGGGGGD